MVKQCGGEGLSGLPMGVGKDLLKQLTSATDEVSGMVKDSIVPTPQTGGRRKRRHGSNKRHSKRRSHRKRHHGGSKRHSKRRHGAKKGGDGGIVATAAVPFGLLALQRYFKGNKSAKNDVRKIGSSFKRTFRR